MEENVLGNFKSTYATDKRVESTVHIISNYLRAATNKLGAKKADTDYFVMTGKLVEDLINYYQNKAAKSALVVDDVGLQVINRLIQEGVKDITLALARVPEENLETVKYIIHNTFKEFNIKIVSIEEIKGMKFDLIIANPPYGNGAEITDIIRKNVEFKEYVNLLPASEYKSVSNLWQYQSDLIIIPNAFSDASVTTSVAKIFKNKVNNMSEEDFEVYTFKNNSLRKYLKKNLQIKDAVIDLYIRDKKIDDIFSNYDITKTAHLGGKTVLPKTHRCITYRYNIDEWSKEQFIQGEHKKNYVAKDGALQGFLLPFNTSNEKHNFVKFIYSELGRQFILYAVYSLNKDSYKTPGLYVPKVDWTRSWTVEEILKEYDYTEEEIKKVMEDLKNFKGMED